MPSLGEGIGLQGVNRQQVNPFDSIVKGIQAGEFMQQRRDAKDQKINELIAKNTQVDPEKFIPALYGKAKEETIKYLQSAQELRSKYGDRKFLYTPEHQQLRANYDFQIANLSEESARAKALQTAAQSGAVVDQDYLKRIGGSYNDYISYKNELTGEYVDPTTGRSNIKAINPYDIQKNAPSYFPQNSPDLYSKKGVRRSYGGGSNDFVQTWELDPEKVKARSELFVKDHPEVVDGYLRTRQQDIYTIMDKTAKEAQANGITVTPQVLAKSAAVKLVEDEMMGRLEKIREEKVGVPEYKNDGNGGGTPKKEWLYTPTTVSDESEIKLVPIPSTGGAWYNQVPVPKGAPYISVQWTGTEMDNKDLTLPTATPKGEVPVEYQPLAFTKKGNDWIFIGGKKVNFDGVVQNIQESINMTENKQAASRIANYFGFDSVSDYISHLETQAKKAKGSQTSTGGTTKKKETAAERAARIARGG